MTESFNRKLGRLAQNVSGTGSITTNASTASAWQTARTITLGGDLSGSVSLDGSSNVSLTATVSGDSIVLGTDTTGNYVATVTAGSGITVSGSGTETASVTVSIDNTVATLTGSQTLTNKTISGADNTLSNIGNASLTNSSITINGTSTSLGGTRTLVTDDIAEDASPTNLWYTDARTRAAISVTDAGGDGSLSYVSGTGVITYTGPSATEVRAHFSAGTGVTITTGQIAIGQAVATTDNVTFAGVTADNVRVGVTAAGEIDTSAGNLTLDSTGGTTVMDDDVNVTGNLQIDGNLTVSGTTVTINATNLAVEDNMIYLNSGSTVTHPDLGFAGNYNDGTYRHAGLFRDESDGRWKFFHQYTPEPDASAYIDITHASFALAPVQASSFIGSVTGNVTGNASTATAWQTARTLSLTGDVTGTSAAFDGSGNISISTTIAADSVALGTDTTGNYVASVTNGSYITGGNGGSEGATLTLAVDATSANTASKVVARDASGNFSAGTITATLSGNASTVTNGVYTTDIGTVTNTMLAGSIANNKLVNSTISGISLGSNLATLTIGTGLSGTSYNGSSAVTIAIDGTSAAAALSGQSMNIVGYSTSVYLGNSSAKQLVDNVWAGTSGYPGYSFSGGNSRFGFSSTSGVIDVYADGNFYATDSSHLVLHAGNYNSYALPVSGGTISGNLGVSGYVDVQGVLYHRTTIQVLNKVGNGWVTWATRNTSGADSVIDLSNIGTFTSTAQTFNSTNSTFNSTNFNVNSTNITVGNDTTDIVGIGNNTVYVTGGNVGIGTTSPAEKLHVSGAVRVGDYFKMGSSAGYMGVLGFNRNIDTGALYNSSYGAYQLQNEAGKLYLQVYNSVPSQVTIHTFDTSGNFGIRTTSPAYTLDVNGSFAFRSTSYAYDSILYAYNSSTGKYFGFTTDASGGKLWMTDGTSPIQLQTSGGNVGIGTTNPIMKLQVNGGLIISQGGDATYAPYFSPSNANTLNGMYGLDSDAGDIWINYRGYLDGFTRFRDFRIGNGKGGVITFFQGSTSRVGIGTESPDYRLDVNGDIRVEGVGNSIFFDTDGASASTWMRTINSYVLQIYNNRGLTSEIRVGNSGLNFYTNGSERMVIDGNGQVTLNSMLFTSRDTGTTGNGIFFYGVTGDNPGSFNHTAIVERLWGTNDQSELLLFKGNDPDTSTIHDRVRIAATGRIVFHSTTVYQTYPTYISDAGTGNIAGSGYIYGNDLVMTGNVTAYSDVRLKTNITDITDALEKVLKIRGVTYNRTDVLDTKKRYAGVIAQEVEQVLPEVVSEDEEGMKNVAYGNMIGLLIEAIKEQQQEIELLKKHIKNSQ